jgi:hypothetical protein
LNGGLFIQLEEEAEFGEERIACEPAIGDDMLEASELLAAGTPLSFCGYGHAPSYLADRCRMNDTA